MSEIEDIDFVVIKNPHKVGTRQWHAWNDGRETGSAETWLYVTGMDPSAECSRVQMNTPKERTVPERAPNDQPNKASGNEIP